MTPIKPPDLRRKPLARLRWEAGGVKAYVDGPPSRRRLMRRRLLLSVLEHYVTPIVAVDDHGMRYLLDTSDRGPITLRIFSDGTYEEPLMERALALLERVSGRPHPLAGSAFVDVGANIGTATLAALKRFGAGQALALEPHPDNFRLLRMNAIANDVDDRVIPVQVAVSESSGELELEVATHNIGDHRIRTGTETGPGAIDEADRAVVRVPAVPLDSIVAEVNLAPEKIGLVWIDVQGHEPYCLAGATTLIEAGVPIVIEYWPYALARAGALDLMHEFVARHFAQVWNLGEEGVQEPPALLAPSDLASLDACYPTEDDSTNLLLLRPESARVAEAADSTAS